MKKILYIDLEETIIRSWDQPFLINTDRIKRFVDKHCFKEVSIFSFAIWNNIDREHFENHIKNEIENCLNISVNNVPTKEEILSIVRRLNRIEIDSLELSTMWGKERSFEDYILSTMNESVRVTLIDDAVQNKIVLCDNVRIKFVNVDNI